MWMGRRELRSVVEGRQLCKTVYRAVYGPGGGNFPFFPADTAYSSFGEMIGWRNSKVEVWVGVEDILIQKEELRAEMDEGGT